MAKYRGLAISFCEAGVNRKRQAETHDKEEKRRDKIPERKPNPVRMIELSGKGVLKWKVESCNQCYREPRPVLQEPEHIEAA